MTVDLPTFLCCLREILQRPPPFAHSRVQTDRQLIQRAAVYHGGLLLADGVGASTVAVYDGLDTSGELIDSFSVATSSPERHIYERGLALRVGLYVDIGANVSVFTAYYDPVPRERG
jgi:hypothetical protein